jgi:uncharacterized protein (TIRG00374 family)
MKKLLPRLLISVGIAALLIWWVTNQGLPIVPSAGAFGFVAWWAVPVYLVSLLLVHFFRAYRCAYLLKPLGNVTTRKLLMVGFAGFFAIMMLPLRTGEFARPYLFKKESGISMSAGMGTIAIERIIDGVIVSLWLTIALFTVPPDRSAYIAYLKYLPLMLFLASLAGLILLMIWTEGFRRLADRWGAVFGKKLHGFVLHVFDGFVDGLRSLPQKSMVLGFTAHTLIYWAINAAGVMALALGCGLDIGFAGASAVMGILAVGILLPTGPGYFGNFQASVMIALAMFLPEQALRDRGAVFILILYLSQVGVTLVAGIVGMIDSHASVSSLMTRPESMQEWSEIP